MQWRNGVYTALVTPFREDCSLDLVSFEHLIERQVQSGVSGIVLWGSTGEGALLSFEERQQLLSVAHAILSKHMKRPHIVLNVGGSSTSEMVALCEQINPELYDAMMVVTPPYVKPPIEGIIRHVQAVQRFGKPVMYYNIPGRTARGLTVEELKKVFETCDHVTALKEASGNLDILRDFKGKTRVTCYVGDDPLYWQSLKENVAEGVVSVISNAVPQTWQTMTVDKEVAFGKIDQVFRQLCVVSNPIGIKHALFRLGVIATDQCRLPLVRWGECSKEDLIDSIGTLKEFL